MAEVIVGGALFVWLLCSIYIYGMTCAFWWREYPFLVKHGESFASEVWMFSIVFSIMGPLGLALTLFLTDGARHGLKWWNRAD